MSKTPETRRQMIREAVRELLPEILPEIIKNQQYESLKALVESRMKEVEAYTKTTLGVLIEACYNKLVKGEQAKPEESNKDTSV